SKLLDNLDRFDLRTFLAFCSYEGNALVFFERFKAGADDVGVVSEQIFAARLRLDEAEALFVVEPLNNTSFCLHFLQSLKIMSDVPYRRLSRCRDWSKKVLYWYWIVLTSTNLKI